MREDWLVKLLDRDLIFDIDTMARVFAVVHGVDERSVDYVERLLPGLAKFLPSALDWVIRADMSLDEAAVRATQVRHRYERYIELLQPFLGYLKIGNSELQSVLLQIDDACADYHHHRVAGRRDANTRRTTSRYEKLSSTLGQAIAQLEEAEHDIDHEYGRAVSAYNRVVRLDDATPLSEWCFDLLTTLRLAQGAIDLSICELKTGSGKGRYIPGNQVKMEIVEAAYHLATGYKGPEFVTTPGSDFSMFASLLFEMASGTHNESMAGAIRRFAVSDERREIDEYHLEYGPSRDEVQMADNFHHIRERGERAVKELRHYQAMIKRPDISDPGRWLSHLLLEAGITGTEELLTMTGPFLIWASQISPADRERHWNEFLQSVEERRVRDIELGEKRRNKSS